MMKNKKFLLGILALASVGTGAARNVAAPAAFPVAELGGRKVMGEETVGTKKEDFFVPYVRHIGDNPRTNLLNADSQYFVYGTWGSYSDYFGESDNDSGNVRPNFAEIPPIGGDVSLMPDYRSLNTDKFFANFSSVVQGKNISDFYLYVNCSVDYNPSGSEESVKAVNKAPRDITDDEYVKNYSPYKFTYIDYWNPERSDSRFVISLSDIASSAKTRGVKLSDILLEEFKGISGATRLVFEDRIPDSHLLFSQTSFDVVLQEVPESLTDGAVKDLYYYIPTIPTVDNILTGISAKDLFGADCTVTCTDTEKAKLQNKIGTYDVKVNASDSYGQTATATLRIHVCDINAPTVALKSGESLVYGYGRDQLVFADLDKKFAVADDGTDYGGGIGQVSYAVDGTALTADREFAVADVGTHKLVVTVSDSSGNKTDTTFTLTVVDAFAPVIQRADSASMYTVVKVGLSETYSFGKSDFLKFFVGKDDVDGDVACALEGDYIPHKVGNYTLKVSATDKAGNKSTSDVPVQVIQDLPPVFILSDTLVEATTKRPLTTAEITAVVTNGILSGQQVKSVSVDASAYVGNEDKVGTYPVNYTAIVEGSDVKKAAGSTSETRNGTFMIKVNDGSSLTGDNATHWYDGIVKFFKGIGDWFRKVFDAIGNFFKVSIPSFFRKLGNWISGKGFKLGD